MDFSKLNLSGKKVLYRACFDVPLINGRIQDDSRILASVPALRQLAVSGARVAIMSWLGRPDKADKNLSMEPVVLRLKQLLPKVAITFSNNYLLNAESQITVLENVRFIRRERDKDIEYGKELAKGYDLVVFDAFGQAHRDSASTVGIIKYAKRAIAGPVLLKEISKLNELNNPPKPFIMLIGGVKLETKQPLVEKFSRLADYIIAGGLVGEELKTRSNPKNVILPIDGIVDESGNVRDIGPGTIALYRQKIKGANTVFFNGNFGKTEDPRFQQGTAAILRELSGLAHTKVYLGGGDTVGFASQLGLADKFYFVSTGGGAALEYLAGKKFKTLRLLKLE